MATSTAGVGGIRPLAIGTAIALAGAAVWTTLVEQGVTVSEPPPFTTGTEAELEAWYAWVSTTLPQRRLARLLLGLSLVGVGLTALRSARPSWGSRGGATVVASAAAIWCLADLAQAGGQRAVELLAAADNPIEVVPMIAFTVDTTTAWLEAGAAILVGMGAAVMARDFLQEQRTRGLGICSVLVGVAGLVFGLLILLPEADTTIAGIALGVVLLPTWVVWLSLVAAPAPVADSAPRATKTVGA